MEKVGIKGFVYLWFKVNFKFALNNQGVVSYGLIKCMSVAE